MSEITAPCPWYRHWWHRRLRARDHMVLLHNGTWVIWSAYMHGHYQPGYYDIRNFPHWTCPCAKETR